MVVLINSAPIDWDYAALLPVVDVLICNQTEAQSLTGLDAACALAALGRQGAGAVVMTLGAEGALVSAPDGPVRIAAPKVDVVDTSGAGDMAAGMLAATVARGRTLVEAARLAVAAASLVVAGAGTLASYPPASELARLGLRG